MVCSKGYKYVLFFVCVILFSCNMEYYFTAGKIGSTGETIKVGQTPSRIPSIESAYHEDYIKQVYYYRWLKNKEVVKTGWNIEPYYEPPLSDAQSAGVYVYNREVKFGNEPDFYKSKGSWLLIVENCNPAVEITTQPKSQNVCSGDTLKLCVEALNAVSYQWKKNGVVIPGATDSIYQVNSATQEHSGIYNVIVSNECIVTSNNTYVNMYTPFNSGAIATTGQTVGLNSLPLTIGNKQSANGGDAQIRYQWLKNGVAIDGATASSYTPPMSDAAVETSHTYTRKAADQTCNTEFIDSEGSWTLTIKACLPTVTAYPYAKNNAYCPGNSLSLSIQATNATKYQWKKNGVAISGAVMPNFTINALTTTDAGSYSVEVFGSCGSIISDEVKVTVHPSFDAGQIESSGETIKQKQKPRTIGSVKDAKGASISYRWYKDGKIISNATGSTYTPPQQDANAEGTYIYRREVVDAVCHTSPVYSSGSWKLTVLPLGIEDCYFNGIPLYGKVRVVESFPDIRVRVVESFPDLKVQKVDYSANSCGKWQFVDSFEDFQIQFVDSFEDIQIQYVEYLPGVP